MAGATISMTFDDTQAAAAIGALRAVGRDPAPLLRAIGVALAQNARERFNAGQDPWGRPWAPLSPAYAKVKTGAGGILVGAGMRGGLQGSITFRTGAASVEVGSNKVYAAIHQFGGTIRPKDARAPVFELGGRTIHAKSVRIPARPYLGFSAADWDSVLDVTGVFMAAALAGRRVG
jgi:phage virion morphogenesis protein